MTDRPRLFPRRRMLVGAVVAGTALILIWLSVHLMTISHIGAFLFGCFWIILQIRVRFGYWPDFR